MITLLPNTNRLRQLIKDHGNQWVMIRGMSCACFGGQIGIEIQSLDESHIRWVKITDTENG